ncbi:MAG: isopentenyl-diphosphate delta-isomerase [Bacteriovoracia bacterium]
MNSTQKQPLSEELALRKEDHIVLAEKARTTPSEIDQRFNYEPLFFKHPSPTEIWPKQFLGFDFNYPLWISSMTGGTDHAKAINENLAKLCGEFKLGMGLGSCRSLLTDKSRLNEFAVKKHMGEQPLFANIGIAQVEQLIADKSESLLHEMVKMVEADGLIIHINPLQEWFQPEGDRFKVSPLDTLKKFLEEASYKVLVKEVGQGMGPKSLRALLELPVAGIELAAFGGTNFTLLEKMRGEADSTRESFIKVGHSALEMVEILNALPLRNKEIIVSGGIKSMLDGFGLLSRLKANSVIGMASAFLGPALSDYGALKEYFLRQRESLLVARSLLELKEEE